MNEWMIVALVFAIGGAVVKVAWGFRVKVVVQAYENALLFRDGEFIEKLKSGKTILWGRGYEVSRVDGRWEEMVVQGQEFLTADRASVKISGIVRYRVVDAVKYFTETQAAKVHLYTSVQMALRDVVGTMGVETVLKRQDSLAEQLKVLVVPAAEKLGLEVDAVLARDLMLAGDLKKAYQATLTAKQEALARLEQARGEAAAMRVTANAARLYEKNPAFMQLRALDAVAKLGEGYNNHLVMGSLDSLLKVVKTE
jgi:regulator of protease activity HflC (stomatin/prohibitin superfamily)